MGNLKQSLELLDLEAAMPSRPIATPEPVKRSPSIGGMPSAPRARGGPVRVPGMRTEKKDKKKKKKVITE